MQRRGPLRRPGRDLPHGARVQRPHAVDAGGDPQGRASLELPDPLGPGGGVAVAEAQLRAFERATLEVAPEVAGVDQGETDARLRSRGRQGEAHLVRVGVAPALLVVVDVVEFADRGDARERHLRVDSGRQRQVALRVEPACQLVHPPSPAPEVPSLPLGSAPQRAVEGVRVGIGEPAPSRACLTGPATNCLAASPSKRRSNTACGRLIGQSLSWYAAVRSEGGRRYCIRRSWQHGVCGSAHCHVVLIMCP